MTRGRNIEPQSTQRTQIWTFNVKLLKNGVRRLVHEYAGQSLGW